MTDKVQKIRKEVARIQLYTQSEVLKQILDYIDSMQEEEPVSKDLDEAAKEDAKIERSDDSEVGYDINRYGGFVAGAKWGRNQAMVEIQAQSMALAHGCPKEHTTEDLEEAAENYATTNKVLPNGKVMINFQAEKAFRAGAKWQFEKVEEALLSEVLPCFMHGGEADEVVAKLDEVLNQKK